jgi:hypothetical protein
MRFPRSSIAGLMTVVVFVAVNCAVLKAILARSSVWNEVFILGVLPMANLLAVGLLPWLRRRPARAGIGWFRVGFEVCGGLAMVAFLVASLQFTDFCFWLPQSFFRPYLALRPGLGLVSSALLIFLGPQLAFALVGGGLVRLVGGKVDRHTIRGSQADDQRLPDRVP